MRIEAFPRVAPVGSTVEIVLSVSGEETTLAPNSSYEVRFFSKVNRQDDARVDLETDDRCGLRVPAAFRACGEYTVEVRRKGVDDILVSAAFYAVSGELAALRPYKADFHTHTTGSDGKNSTLEMLVRARELGMDLVAITDHDNYEPSCRAEQEAAALGTGLLVLKGEEIAIRGIGGHVLSLNAGQPVGGKRRWTPETDKEYAEIAAGLAGRDLIAPLTAETYATAAWTAIKIREAGGLAFMAHPCWEGSKGKYYPPRCVVEQMLRDDLLDGIELIGGSPTTEGNMLAVAKYTEEAAKGNRLAITGGSDAHSVDELGRKFTVVLAERLTTRDIVAALVNRRSVACDTQLGPSVAAFGPFDVLEYAYFLLRVYFPLHDALCSERAGAGQLAVRLDDLSRRFWYVA